MNKCLLTLILFSLMMNAKGQNLKVIKLEKAKDYKCVFQGEHFRIDSVNRKLGKLCLSNSLKQITIGIDDNLSFENKNYSIILIQSKKPPVLRGMDIDDKIKTTSKLQIPESLGIYFEQFLASCLANNTSSIKFKSTLFDIIWLLPSGDKNRFFAERIRPRKYRKLLSKNYN